MTHETTKRFLKARSKAKLDPKKPKNPEDPKARERLLKTYGAEIRADLLKTIALLVKGWCQGAMARDGDGDRCTPHDGCAMSFCLTGGLARVVKGERNIRALREIERVIEGRLEVPLTHEQRLHGLGSAIRFNDQAENVDEVVALLGEVAQEVAA